MRKGYIVKLSNDPYQFERNLHEIQLTQNSKETKNLHFASNTLICQAFCTHSNQSEMKLKNEFMWNKLLFCDYEIGNHHQMIAFSTTRIQYKSMAIKDRHGYLFAIDCESNE